MAICIVAALTSTLLLRLPDQVTLAWEHTVEKIRWEEDYTASASGLVLTEARLKGTGAGMEMPPDATLRGGAWHYRPALPALQSLYLRNSRLPLGYELCWGGRCTRLAALIGPDDRLLALMPCAQSVDHHD
jgi:hypothetical protein